MRYTSVNRWATTLVVAALTAVASAQTPRIGYVYPAGGKQGATFQVAVGGQFLDGVVNAHLTGKGVTATVIEHFKPLTPGQANKLREELSELQKKRAADTRGRRSATQPAFTEADGKRIEEIQKKLATFIPKLSSPAIAERVTLQVTLAPDAEVGQHELRLATPAAITNPLVFCVNQLPEFSKPKGDEPKPRPFRYRVEEAAVAPTETQITLPAVVNGQTLQGGVDRFRFAARKGQRIVAIVSAQSLIPYIADAVPGWFQPVVALYDAKGKQVAYADDFRFRPDPVLSYAVVEDGEYALEIRDAVYRGREDFVYRIAIGELPFVTSVFPLGCQAGTQVSAEVRGQNLLTGMVSENAKDKTPGIYDLVVRKGSTASNRVPFRVDDIADLLEKEPNNTAAAAQTVTLPIIINGRIGHTKDWDVFRFDGHAGDKVVAEVYARRLDSPLDSVLKVTDAAGQQLAFNDDHEDKSAALTTHQADSYVATTLPADGAYYVHIGDGQDKGGSDYAYRLRISAPRPDYAIRAVPSSINIRPGASAPITVYALRKDGFAGEINLTLKDAPPGFRISGGRVPAGADQVRLTLTAASSLGAEPVPIALQGSAKIDGREVVREAVPAEDMMQAFAYHHLVPAKEMLVSGSDRWSRRGAVKILSPTPAKIPLGGTTRVLVGAPPRTPMGEIRLELSEPPEGISIQKVSPARDGTVIVLKSDAEKVKPGLKGNLIFNILLDRGSSGPKNKGAARNIQLGTLPALPFEVVTGKAGDKGPLSSRD